MIVKVSKRAVAAVIAVLAVAASRCSGPTGGGAPSNSNSMPTWQVVIPSLPSGLLSVSGTAANDVYIVGADDGQGSFVAHYDGAAWRRIATQTQGNLWWITAIPIDGDFFIGGDDGLLLRLNPQTNTFERLVTPGTGTVFGIWGLTQQDIWAVGGDLENQGTGGFIWRFDGRQWAVQDLTALFPQGFPTIFKVWGRRADDVYAVGAAGILLHFDGSGWTSVETGTDVDTPLFSVFGNNDITVAVGGFNIGFILERGQDAFQSVAAPGTIQMNGVCVRPDGFGASVGRELAVAFRQSSGWQVQRDTGLGRDRDFHADWFDPDGGLWAVGGNLLSSPINNGILVYYGTASIGTQFSGP